MRSEICQNQFFDAATASHCDGFVVRRPVRNQLYCCRDRSEKVHRIFPIRVPGVDKQAPIFERKNICGASQKHSTAQHCTACNTLKSHPGIRARTVNQGLRKKPCVHQQMFRRCPRQCSTSVLLDSLNGRSPWPSF